MTTGRGERISDGATELGLAAARHHAAAIQSIERLLTDPMVVLAAAPHRLSRSLGWGAGRAADSGQAGTGSSVDGNITMCLTGQGQGRLKRWVADEMLTGTPDLQITSS